MTVVNRKVTSRIQLSPLITDENNNNNRKLEHIIMPSYRFGKHAPKLDYHTLRLGNYLTPKLAAPPASYNVLPTVPY